MDQQRFAWFKENVWPIPFHKFLELELQSASGDTLEATLRMRPDLRGNFGKGGAMHGGAVAAMVDAVCGYLSAIAVTQRLREAGVAQEEIDRRTARLATVDMHLDYIRPLRSEVYRARSSIVHAGSTIMRTRAEVFDETDALAATAGANYSY